MSNGTTATSYPITSDCFDIKCSNGKICVEDKDADEGYRCRPSKKRVVKCDEPGEFLNANRIPIVRDHKFSPGERVIINCNDGYHLSTSDRTMGVSILCQKDGTWSPEIPTCIKFGVTYKTPVTSKMESSSVKTDIPSTSVNPGLIIIAFLLPILLLALIAWLLLRYRNRRTHRRLIWRCREASNPVVYENNFPSMPENLEEEAVSVKDFAQYVAVRHNNGDRIFHEEFEEIQNLPTQDFSWDTSVLEENKEKNRYTNIVAYEHTRVRLNRGKKSRHTSSARHSDYINANYVSSYEQPKAYIACQGPLPETYNDFWKMIWDNNVSVIVMITNLVEKGRRKCDQYWPQDGREQYKHLSVMLRDVDVYANYTVRTFQLRDTKQSKRRSYNNERRVLQFHYTQWPDHGTPEYILPLLTFIRRSSQANTVETAPIVVHCSAGVGRTGAYIMLHSMIQMALKTGKINVNKFLRFIRMQRNHLVQTEDQYIFLHDALLCHFTCGNTECAAQQLGNYVQNLLIEPAPWNGNGVQIAESVSTQGLEMAPTEHRTGMERQFLIVARHVVHDIDYDFAVRSVNQSKNRSNGILPVFRSRVPLHYRIGSEGSDYINASFLQGYRNGKMFIITQLPLPNTRKDFWSLVWDQNCSVIITIRDKVWDDAKDAYWPSDDSNISCPLFNVSSDSKNTETHNFGDVTVKIRQFQLEATKDDYVLSPTQMDITGWPSLDKLSPDFTQLLDLVVRRTDIKDGSVIVQDRFGGTSAGQLACAHSLHQQLANENAVNVFQAVRVAYQMRPGIFNTHRDLHFLYKAMLLQTNPAKFSKAEANHEKAANSLKNSTDITTTDKTPLLATTGESSIDSKSLENQKTELSAGDGDNHCDVKKEDEQDNDSQYDLLDNDEVELLDDITATLGRSSPGDAADDSLIIVEEPTLDSKNDSTTLEIQNELDDSVTSTAKLLK